MKDEPIIPQFELCTQLPKPKVLGKGKPECIFNQPLSFFDCDGRTVAVLAEPRIRFCGGHGIMIEGMEPNGVDKTGRPQYKFQQWFLRYLA